MVDNVVSVQPAREVDVTDMVALSAARRIRYAQAQPVFWKVAPDADERQAAWFTHLFTLDTVLPLVARSGNDVQGFVVAQLVPNPPVYDPGGPTCVIDDFEVLEPHGWPTAGRHLLEETLAWARGRGAAQVVVVCGHHDEPKRRMLQDAGFPVASEWRVQSLQRGPVDP